MIYNILLATTAITVMFLPILLSFVFSFSIFQSREYFTLSIYGVYMIFYMLIQMIFAYLNKRRVEKIYENNPEISGKYNILVVGYREDPLIFKKCLESILLLDKKENINKVIVVIDGDERDDFYMAQMASDILGAEIVCSAPLSSGPGVEINLNNELYSCILQTHKGKRHALYTGLKLSCISPDVDGVLCTDSDTDLEKNSLYFLANLLESSDRYGAVTGNVKILNTDSFISYVSSLRYWFACNLERAYQSFNNCVLCVSGPLGLYRTECLREFLDPWLRQEFMGKEANYGDDRHLTNNVLLLGYRVGYTHLAECLTDTPETLSRFFTQQLRWAKSSLREFLWNVKSLDKHSPWMSIDLVYQTVYSFIVLGSLIYILFFGTTFQLLIYVATLLGFNGIKGLYASSITGNLKYSLFSFYGIIYISILAPAKLYAGLTLSDVSWGTSNRLDILNKFEPKHLFLLLWNCIISAGIAFNIYMNQQETTEYIAIASVCGYILFLTYTICILSIKTPS